MGNQMGLMKQVSETETDQPLFRLSQNDYRPPFGFLPATAKRSTPLQQVPSTAELEGRICILDGDADLSADLAGVLESMGHEVMVINEIIGASNRIRAFAPEILIIDNASTALPGPKLIDVLRRNLRELPRIVFFTDTPHQELQAMGLGEYEWHPKARGFLSLVNRLRVLLLYDRAEEKERVPRA